MWLGPWPSVRIMQIESSLQSLERLVDRIAKSEDDEAIGSLARFLVVRSCGYLEQVTEECCRSYISTKADRRAGAFAASWLGHGRGVHPENLIALAGKFDATWADELTTFFDDDDQEFRREVSFLVDRRNKIAHGISEGIGARKALDLATYAQLTADWFIRRLDPR